MSNMPINISDPNVYLHYWDVVVAGATFWGVLVLALLFLIWRKK